MRLARAIFVLTLLFMTAGCSLTPEFGTAPNASVTIPTTNSAISTPSISPTDSPLQNSPEVKRSFDFDIDVTTMVTPGLNDFASKNEYYKELFEHTVFEIADFQSFDPVTIMAPLWHGKLLYVGSNSEKKSFIGLVEYEGTSSAVTVLYEAPDDMPTISSLVGCRESSTTNPSAYVWVENNSVDWRLMTIDVSGKPTELEIGTVKETHVIPLVKQTQIMDTDKAIYYIYGHGAGDNETWSLHIRKSPFKEKAELTIQKPLLNDGIPVWGRWLDFVSVVSTVDARNELRVYELNSERDDWSIVDHSIAISGCVPTEIDFYTDKSTTAPSHASYWIDSEKHGYAYSYQSQTLYNLSADVQDMVQVWNSHMLILDDGKTLARCIDFCAANNAGNEIDFTALYEVPSQQRMVALASDEWGSNPVVYISVMDAGSTKLIGIEFPGQST